MQFGQLKRREFITLLATAWPLALRAQERVRRIGVLLNASADDAEYQARLGAFLQGLQQADWAIGRNVRIETRWAGTNAADIRRHAGELGALSPDVVLATGNLAVRSLKQASPATPIVFVGLIDPVGAGFIESLARPGGSTTGFLLFEYSLSGKWVDLLKEIAPGTTRVAVLRDPEVSSGPAQFGVIQAVAPSLRIDVTPVNVRDASGMERTRCGLRAIRQWRPYRDGQRVSDDQSRSDRHVGREAQIADDLLQPRLRHGRRPRLVWARLC